MSDPNELRDALGRQLGALGFDRFAYLMVRAPRGGTVPVSIATFPDEWRRYYDDRDYLSFDPVLQFSASRLLPFDWTTLRNPRLTTRKQRRVLDEASEFAISKGVTVPIHSPNGGMAVLSVSADTSDRDFQSLWSERRDTVHLLGLYFHATVEEKFSSENVARVRITDRERECLLWTARGKTGWETSEILNISEETVVFHLKNAMAKLGVFSKHHAVVKAIMSGLIHP